MAKQINIQRCRTGRVRRWGIYDDLRSAACAYGLLVKAGCWKLYGIKKLPLIDKYKVYAEIIPFKKMGVK